MKKLSETLKELGIDFTFPIEIKDANGNETYYENIKGYWIKREYDTHGNQTFYFEDNNGYWRKCEYDANGNETYFEDNTGFWSKFEYDANGNQTYYEDSDGDKEGTPRSQSCAGKVIEVDGKKYKLKEL
jgi:YD repeat-containing protein